MSYTTILGLWPGEKVEGLQELRNSHGSAPHVWSALCQKYLGNPNSWLIGNTDDLWALWKDDRLSKVEQTLLVMTFDRFYVEKANYKRAADDIQAFFKLNPVPENYVNHWPAIEALLRSEPECPAVGFWWTSVSDRPFQGSWDEALEDYGPFDWSKSYEVYKELEACHV